DGLTKARLRPSLLGRAYVRSETQLHVTDSLLRSTVAADPQGICSPSLARKAMSGAGLQRMVPIRPHFAVARREGWNGASERVSSLAGAEARRLGYWVRRLSIGVVLGRHREQQLSRAI